MKIIFHKLWYFHEIIVEWIYIRITKYGYYNSIGREDYEQNLVKGSQHS